MNEENKNTITYDDDWKNVSVAEYPKRVEHYSDDEYAEEYVEDNSDNENKNIPKKKNNSPKQLLITFQLIACIIIALTAFAIKNIGGSVYDTVREWYYSELNSSLIFEEAPDFSIGSLFGTSTSDEA